MARQTRSTSRLCWTRRRALRVGGLFGSGLAAGCVDTGGDGGDDGTAPTDADTHTDSNGDRTSPDDAETIQPPTTDDPERREDAGLMVEEIATGLAHPWGLAFLPGDTRMLVTERPGRLRLLDRVDGTLAEVSGVPDVYAMGQGGLLDVTLHPGYPDEPWLYLTYAASNGRGESTTHVGRGRLERDAHRLDGFEPIHVAEPFVESDVHFGSRVEFGPDEKLYVTVGDRGFKNFGPDHVSQDTSNELGSVLRLEPDGSIPADNPFVDDPAVVDSVYTYGHRNPQGLTVHPETGALWASEHGEQDGDEINVLDAGSNYGWPIADAGCTYGGGEPIGGDETERDDVVGPVHSWGCSTGGFPPGGTTFYDGDAFGDWQGDLFVGTLAGAYLGRFRVDGDDVTEADELLADRGWRIRDVETAPDTGHLYLAVDEASAVIARLSPLS